MSSETLSIIANKEAHRRQPRARRKPWGSFTPMPPLLSQGQTPLISSARHCYYKEVIAVNQK